jgi:hypothetical protein
MAVLQQSFSQASIPELLENAASPRGISGDVWEYHDEHGEKFRVHLATTRELRERAYRLAHSVYQKRGYVPPDSDGMIVSTFDADAHTFTLLAEDSNGRAAGTVTLAFDCGTGLPSDEIYGPELTQLRRDGCRLSEVVRLAIDEAHAHSKSLLVNMFILCSVYARRVMNYSDFVIEVNPRHVTFYKRMLSFEPAGPERLCPRVQDAPAVLLRLNLKAQEEVIGRVGGTNSYSNGRSLYAHFCSLQEELPIAEFLNRLQQPMSAEDAAYFLMRLQLGRAA